MPSGVAGFSWACSAWRCFTTAGSRMPRPRSSSTRISSTASCRNCRRRHSRRPTSIEATVHSFRLIAIDPRTRRFLIACQIEGEFHPPVTGPISERVGRSPQTPEGWRKFRFDVKARVNIEPGLDGAPRFRIEIDEVKKRELDGFSGVVARFLGQYFDELVTQLASGRASRLNNRLNDEIKKRVTLVQRIRRVPGHRLQPVGRGSSLRRDAVPIRRHRRLRLRRGAARHGPPLSLVSPAGWFPLLHDPAPTHPTGPTRSARASRVTFTTIRSRKQPHFSTGASVATSSTQSRRTVKTPAAPATGLWALPATSIAIPNREPCRSTASLTRSGINIFTRSTRMPSSRSRQHGCVAKGHDIDRRCSADATIDLTRSVLPAAFASAINRGRSPGPPR